MTCLRDNVKGADQLIGYLEGTLPPGDRAEIDEHAAACAECRALLAVQATMGDEVPEVSGDFDARLYARIEQDRQQQWWRRWLFRPAVPLAAAAAILAVMMFVRMPSERASLDRVELEQLEQALDDLELLMPPGTATEAL